MVKWTVRVFSLMVLSIPVAYGATTVDFTAVELGGDLAGGSWNFGLYDGGVDWKPDASGQEPVTSGVEMYWQLAFDGAGALIYSWGAAPGTYSESISINLGPEDFNYLTVSALEIGNNKQNASIDDLVLKTDLGVLNGSDIDSSANSNAYTFMYDNVQSFGSFTLSGSTMFDWTPTKYDTSYMGVVITGGNMSAVVPEPQSALLVAAGLILLAARAVTKQFAMRKELAASVV
ncbi:MAG: hypothetical protein IT366_03215 [Candidatus Hydrogenedentes bacterium]|nr:hypothetical protein [Candidatus Hydrogenedentota bacterium]